MKYSAKPAHTDTLQVMHSLLTLPKRRACTQVWFAVIVLPHLSHSYERIPSTGNNWR